MPEDESSLALQELQSSVKAFLARVDGPRHHPVRIRDGAVKVRLFPDDLPLAEELVREFGDAIHVRVGFKAFPSGETDAGESIARGINEMPREFRGIRVSLESRELTIRSGKTGHGEVVVRNTGPGALAGALGGAYGWLRRPGTPLIVGGHLGWIAGVGRRFPENPGESVNVGFTVGTFSCEPGPGYCVPAGRYEVVAQLNLKALGDEAWTTLAVEGGSAAVL
jgi:hypothetical protein